MLSCRSPVLLAALFGSAVVVAAGGMFVPNL
jgi:hypothetical protein